MKDNVPLIDLYISGSEEWAPGLRKLLRQVLTSSKMMPCWSEYYAGVNNIPYYMQELQVGVLLINHTVVWKYDPEDPEMPSQLQLSHWIKSSADLSRYVRLKMVLKTYLSFILAIIIAFFPKCPFCWGAYMSMLSVLGISSFSYQPWFLPVLIVLFFINLWSLYATRKRHGNKLLFISIAGAVVIIANRLWVDQPFVLYIGASMLIFTSLWNSLPKRIVTSIKIFCSRKLVAPVLHI